MVANDCDFPAVLCVGPAFSGVTACSLPRPRPRLPPAFSDVSPSIVQLEKQARLISLVSLPPTCDLPFQLNPARVRPGQPTAPNPLSRLFLPVRLSRPTQRTRLIHQTQTALLPELKGRTFRTSTF